MIDDSRKYIELIGIGLPNRGAELLARTVMQECTEKYGRCVFATSQKLPPEELKRLGLKRCLRNGKGPITVLRSKLKGQKLRKSQRRKFRYGLLSLLSRNVREYLGYVLEQDVDLVLDASGFAYGDYWGAKKAQRRLTDRLPQWKANNVPLVLLPQSYGSFDEEGFEESFKPAVDYASLICVRDQQSKSYLEKFTSRAELFPDITFSLDGFVSDGCSDQPYSLFIPNQKVIDSGSISRSAYISLAQEFVALSRELGVEPVILNHEGSKDLDLCREMALSEKLRILDPRDALRIKGIIAEASFVFSSRYHGVVSSLATCTPVVVLGWSHKYRELLADFSLEHCLIANESHALMQLKEFCKEDNLAKVRKKIGEKLPHVRQSLRSLWEEVFASVSG